MPRIVKSHKPLSVDPLKVSQPVGAALAFLGLEASMPLMHGSQGCTAFAKVFFVRHFREPIPLQTTAMDQIATVMGADENVIEALSTIASKSRPQIIGLLTTGLSETQGSDIHRLVKEFRATHPELASTAVVAVNSPDTVGCLESGYALAVEAIIDTLVPPSDQAGKRPRQVNILAGSQLTPGDIEVLKDWCAAFDLQPVVLPDIGEALDGHLIDAEFTPLTLGGTSRAVIAALGESAATLVIGDALSRAADLLHERTEVPNYRFTGLMGLAACDAFTQTLAQIAGRPVPPALERQRAQLQDAMVDCHFMTGFARLALAGDPDLLAGFIPFLTGMGAEIAAAVTPIASRVLDILPLDEVLVGDLQDLEHAASRHDAQLIIANSHAAALANRLGAPLLRAGFPQYDWVGGYARTWIGYRGSRQTLFDLANLMLSRHHEIPPYRSLYWSGSPRAQEAQAAVSRPLH